MAQCIRCGSHAINHHAHGRDGSDRELCDVCYWRRRAEQPVARKPLTDEQIDLEIQLEVDPVATYRKLHNFARAIERAHGIT